jgi:competence ComEA-like helix-hairpin-helix protein
MSPFKPAEIRVIVFLALLAVAGSIVTLLQRQGKMAAFNPGILAEKGPYRYSYKASSPIQKAASDTSNVKSDSVKTAIGDSIKIDLNHCGYYDFVNLPGIGPALAQRIIAYRDSAGQFRNVEELQKVKGIGPAKFAAIRNRVAIQ